MADGWVVVIGDHWSEGCLIWAALMAGCPDESVGDGLARVAACMPSDECIEGDEVAAESHALRFDVFDTDWVGVTSEVSSV